MGDEQRQAIARLCAEDAEFLAAMADAKSAHEAAQIAVEHGIPATEADFTTPEDRELSDADLELASGGVLDQIWPTTPWVAC